MRTFPALVLLGVSLCLAGVAIAQAPAPRPRPGPARPSPARPATRQSASKPAATIRDIMQSMVNPASKVLFRSVTTEMTSAGPVETSPQTAEEWATVRNNGLSIIEASQLLLFRGRRVADPGDGAASEPPEKGALTPAQIQALLARNRATFDKMARAMSDAGRMAVKAADARDPAILASAVEDIDTACENCHMSFWFPNQKFPDVR